MIGYRKFIAYILTSVLYVAVPIVFHKVGVPAEVTTAVVAGLGVAGASYLATNAFSKGRGE